VASSNRGSEWELIRAQSHLCANLEVVPTYQRVPTGSPHPEEVPEQHQAWTHGDELLAQIHGHLQRKDRIRHQVC
jgi:hypothetical protein